MINIMIMISNMMNMMMVIYPLCHKEALSSGSMIVMILRRRLVVEMMTMSMYVGRAENQAKDRF